MTPVVGLHIAAHPNDTDSALSSAGIPRISMHKPEKLQTGLPLMNYQLCNQIAWQLTRRLA